MAYEYSLSGKWVELLKQIAPGVTRVAVLCDPTTPTGIGQFGVIQAVGLSLGGGGRPVGVGDAPGIERAIPAFGQGSNSGLILSASGSDRPVSARCGLR